MKPISLEMFGFMTYKNKTIIDFTKLYESKIFLISGQTGSGKTSIFDAISFALFGEIQREGFDKNDIRSDFLSGDEKESYVDFKFEIDNKIYRIKRIPNQIAKKTRSNVNIKHSVELYKCENDREILLADKINDCDKLIKEIIGLDYNQLNRVMILAQGEFSKFLKSSSDEKAGLLSKIFQTFVYKDIEEILKQKSKDSKKNLDLIAKNLKIEIRKNEYLDNLILDKTIELKDFDDIYKIIDENLENSYSYLEKKEKEKENININFEDENKKYSLYKNQNEQIEIFLNLIEEKERLYLKKEEFDEKKEKLNLSKNAEKLYPYYKSLNETKYNIKNYMEKKDEIKENIIILEKTKISLENEGKDIENLKISLDEKKENLIKLKEIIEAFKQKDLLEKEINKYKKDYEKSKELDKSIDEKEKQLSDIRQKINEKSEKIIEFNKISKEFENKVYKSNTSKLENENLLNLAIENDKKIKELGISKKNISILNEDLKQCHILLEKAKDNRRYRQINIFKNELNEKGKCPICGSIHNNEISLFEIEDLDFDKINEQYISLQNKIEYEKNRDFSINKDLKDRNFYEKNKKEIDENISYLRNKLLKVEEDLEIVNKEKKELITNEQKINEFIKKSERELSSLKNLDDIEKLEQKYNLKKEELEKYDYANLLEKQKNEKIYLENADKKIKDYEKRYLDLEKKYDSLISLNKSYDEILDENKNRKKEQEKEFNEKLKEYFENIDEFIATLKFAKKYLQEEKDIEDFFEKIKTIEIKISSLSQYRNKKIVNLDEILTKIKQLKENIKKIEDEIFNIKFKISKLSNSKDEIKKIDESLNKLHKEDEILYKLSKITDGSMSKVEGYEKLNLETFVLTNYFKKILKFANIRLTEMTDGQFKMIRKRESSDKRKNFGLDIEILDANTGKVRSEASLSGGESFIASLALALGLSDEISQENGGIKIDTLFIDEGFGTLSDDYLDKAIRTIEKLSYDNKFIGLISHVKELKDSIDAKIEVKYSKIEGSSLEVIV